MIDKYDMTKSYRDKYDMIKLHIANIKVIWPYFSYCLYWVGERLRARRSSLAPKITISDRRNRLRIEVIQAIECLKSWLNIVEALDDEIEDIEDVAEKPPEREGDGEVDLTIVS